MPTSDLTVDRPGGALYDGFKNDLSYTRVTGRLVLPVASGSPVVIRTHQEYGVVRRLYGGSKKGSPPMAPAAAESDTVLTQTHTLPLPVPIQSGGGSGYLYSMAGVVTTLETSPSTPTTGYAYPGWPFRIEPMATEAERAGYRYNRNELTTFTPEPPRFDDPGYQWPQALVHPAESFSTDIP